ncbi:YihY/virulence factor BrkB family protein [Nocardioides sp. P86]|uniref:YihY/virulence factor BrkB family protein n=1 Tax=Nocardioides sp. P86 TaxID=2939569 RepID=UPI00203F48A9|nr:YihY/virulence factor BrkB family protein [Nocardioides sp. P86]MCM3513746.1 YihY/virulence factor BrkB family protein [Nocardioides sp. P86]
MATPTPQSAEGSPLLAWGRRAAETLWRLLVATVGACLRFRVTGLAAEAAFFAVVSVPPLVFALAGAIGYVSEQFSAAQVADVRAAILEISSRALTEGAVRDVIEPTIDDVLGGGRFDVVSLGFVLALWSGSRALNVFVDTITIMHGLGGHRGIVKTRALSFVLYVLAMITGVVSLPLVVAGPSLVGRWLPDRAEVLMHFYWPLVLVLCICFLATLYHVSVPVRTNWSFNLPGAVFSLVAWIAGSYALRWVLTVTASDSRSIYGPLAAPIAVLLWLYLVAIAVLIGAAVNAAFDTVFPQSTTSRARTELVARLRQRLTRERADDGEPDARPATEPASSPAVGPASPAAPPAARPAARPPAASPAPPGGHEPPPTQPLRALRRGSAVPEPGRVGGGAGRVD